MWVQKRCQYFENEKKNILRLIAGFQADFGIWTSFNANVKNNERVLQFLGKDSGQEMWSLALAGHFILLILILVLLL